jgi:hypothetical protein
LVAGEASGDDLAGHGAGIVIQLDDEEIGVRVGLAARPEKHEYSI